MHCLLVFGNQQSWNTNSQTEAILGVCEKEPLQFLNLSQLPVPSINMVLLECAAAATTATAATAAPSSGATVAFIAPIATAMAMSQKWGETEVAKPWYEVAWQGAWHVIEAIYEDVSETLGIEPWRTQERLAELEEEAAAREEYMNSREYREILRWQQQERGQILQIPTPHGRRGGPMLGFCGQMLWFPFALNLAQEF